MFYDTIIAAVKNYYPHREDVFGFLNAIQTWRSKSNSKQRYSANHLGNVILLNDKQTKFFRLLAFWIQ